LAKKLVSQCVSQFTVVHEARTHSVRVQLVLDNLHVRTVKSNRELPARTLTYVNVGLQSLTYFLKKNML
jgi:hypothetical protein